MTTPNGTTVFDFRMSGKWIGASCPDEDAEEEESSDDLAEA